MNITNNYANHFYHQINQLSREITRSYDNMKSPEIANPSEISKYSKLEANIRGGMMAEKNIQDGISMIQKSNQSLSQMEEIGNRLYELSIQYQNDTLDDKDKGQIEREAVELIEEFNHYSQNTTFNNKKVFENDRVTIQTGTKADDKYSIKMPTFQEINVQEDKTISNKSSTKQYVETLSSPTEKSSLSHKENEPSNHPNSTQNPLNQPSNQNDNNSIPTFTLAGGLLGGIGGLIGGIGNALDDTLEGVGDAVGDLVGGIGDALNNITGDSQSEENENQEEPTETEPIEDEPNPTNPIEDEPEPTNPIEDESDSTTPIEELPDEDETPQPNETPNTPESPPSNNGSSSYDLSNISIKDFLNPEIVKKEMLEPLSNAKHSLSVSQNILESRLNFQEKSRFLNEKDYFNMKSNRISGEMMKQIQKQMLLDMNSRFLHEGLDSRRSMILKLLG